MPDTTGEEYQFVSGSPVAAACVILEPSDFTRSRRTRMPSDPSTRARSESGKLP